MTEDKLNEISGLILGAAIEVHRTMGPGLLEDGIKKTYDWFLENQNTFKQVSI